MELFRLFGSILVNNDEANNSIDKTDKKASGVAETLGNGIKTAAMWGAGLVTATGAAVGGMLAMANQTADAADAIDKLSERTGIGRENLQKWKYAADQSGADIGKLEVGVKKLSDVMDGATTGNKASAKAFQELGVSLKNADGSMRSTEAVFEDVMFALSDMEQGAKRNALGNDLLGKSYTEMLPLLNAGSDGMEGLRIRAEELGLVMSEDAVKANVVFGDTMADVKASLGAIVMQITNQLLPMLQGVLDWILSKMPVIQSVAGTGFKILGDAIKFVIDNSNILIPVLVGLFGAITALTIINTVSDLMKAWQASTFAQTLAQEGLNAALRSNPIGLVVTAIGLLVTAGVLLYKNWDTVKAKALDVFGAIKGFVSPIINGIANAFKNMVNGVVKGLNVMIRGLNKLNFTIPEWVPGVGGKGFGFSIPEIPMLAKGTDYFSGGYAIVGEQGPELVKMPRGTTVMNNRDTQKTLSNSNRPLEVVVMLDGATIAKATAPHIDKIQGSTFRVAARGRGL